VCVHVYKRNSGALPHAHEQVAHMNGKQCRYAHLHLLFVNPTDGPDNAIRLDKTSEKLFEFGNMST